MGDPTNTLSTHDAAWLAETFRRNRERFAGWRMEADPPAPPADPEPTPDPAPEPQPTPDDGKGGKDAILADLAKERDKRQALEQQMQTFQQTQQQQMDAIAKALGLKSDDTPPDAEQLTAQVAAEQTRAREAALQLAVYRTAGAHEANPDVLLDSASFLKTIAEIDPSDADKVSAAIKAAVETNPLFKAASSPPPTPPFPGGPRPPAPTRAGSLGEAIQNRISRPNR